MTNGMSGAECTTEAREVNLNAVRDDTLLMSEKLVSLELTVQRLRDHLIGVANLKEVGAADRPERETPTGLLTATCEQGVKNLTQISRIQEAINQVCYLLGEGR